MSSIATTIDGTNQSNALWRQNSIVSATSSNITSSSGEDSILSMEFSERDSFQASSDHLSFFTDKSDNLYQLMDDLAIIDEIYHTFGDESECEPYEQQVADAARNVAQKKMSIERMCQSEEDHITDMEQFLFYFLEPIHRWTYDSANADVFQKFPAICSRTAIATLFETIKEITKVHQELYTGLRDRLKMWGPTQFVSDILASFHEKMPIYEKYLKYYASFIVTIDTLCRKSPQFCKFLESCVPRTDAPNIKDVVFYLKNPIVRLPFYSSFVSQISTATELSHPDYRALVKLKDKYERREKEWRVLLKDRLALVRVLEAARSIQNNPAIATTNRRLFITGPLTKVDMSDPQSMSDTRTHLLYNDIFMYCQKVKMSKKKSDNNPTLVYKGMINLKHAEIVPLSPSIIARLSETKRSLGLSFMRKSDTPSLPNTAIYGFEIKVNDRHEQPTSVAWNNGTYPVPGHNSGNGSKRQLIMRTQTEAEQEAWIALLRKVSQQVTRKR
ncbi:Dbl homology domain-containing protein [Gilbertella persicaria]|uniref:Dbl homology domain-containing protein n=1 Tax=Gilbertella persicaria TaxID=101096 RepID=UPI00221FD9D9|nr:Dbl homology domain-containing protein [Gilbertella persicaria]KAI8090221.1 Dbl homology domain-containing protein [Gilbertella persicaria]